MAEGHREWLTTKLQWAERTVWTESMGQGGGAGWGAGGCYMYAHTWTFFCTYMFMCSAVSPVLKSVQSMTFLFKRHLLNRLTVQGTRELRTVRTFSFENDFLKCQRGHISVWLMQKREIYLWLGYKDRASQLQKSQEFFKWLKSIFPPLLLISVPNTVAMLTGVDQIEPPMAGDEHSSVYS